MSRSPEADTSSPRSAGILVVDDTPANLTLLVGVLSAAGHRTRPVPSGRLALRAVESDPPDLILLDVNMPEMNGYEVCARLKADERFREIPVVFISALSEPEDRVRAFAAGAVDCVAKPFHAGELQARVSTYVRMNRLRRELEERNRDLTLRVADQARRISEAHRATIFALTQLFEARDKDSGAPGRMRRYCRALATRLAERGDFEGLVDAAFVESLEAASPLHDIGKLRIPEAVLRKAGPLTAEEWNLVRTHPEKGAAALESVLESHPDNAFVRMGAEIARSHHERWDGGGYPNGLAGDAIPLPARVLTIADQYDALRSARPHKPPLPHLEAMRILTVGDGRTSPGHFDGRVLDAFVDRESEFASIWGGPGHPGAGRLPRD